MVTDSVWEKFLCSYDTIVGFRALVLHNSISEAFIDIH